MVLSNNDVFNLSKEFLDVFKDHTDICMTFEEFVKSARIEKICVPAFIAHGNSEKDNNIETYLKKMNTNIMRRKYFGLDTEYLFKVFDAFDFYNLVGRTGRLYQHYLGIAHYIKSPNDPSYEKNQAVKSIEFELTDNSIDMDINFGNYTAHPEFVNVLNMLVITYDEYREKIARKHRFSTVQFLLSKHFASMGEISVISRYIISRLIS